MKKILIATSALVAVSAPAFALDVKTSGAVEYRYTKDKAGNVAQNAKLSQQDAHIKFAASGASNGLAYGAWIKSKSGTSTTSSTKGSGATVYAGNVGDYDVENFRKMINMAGKSDTQKQGALEDLVSISHSGTTSTTNGATSGYWTKIGIAQNGDGVWAFTSVTAKAGGASSVASGDAIVTDGAATAEIASANVAEAYAIGQQPTKNAVALGTSDAATTIASSSDQSALDVYGIKGLKAATSQTLANNATTQSAMWVNGAFGGLVIGQDGDATGLAPSGSVNAASFTGGTQLAYFTAGNKGERVTYTAPTFVDGLKVSYTHNFKGNVSTTKADKVKAPTSYGVQYATDVMGVAVKVGYAQANLGKTGTNKALKNTKTGVELGYGGFTVGYGTFTIGKKAFQKKDTTGTNYGVKYASGAWAVGYTVNKSEDKNKYITHSNKTASTNAISASYKVADGFSVYASKSSNKVKNTNGKTAKNNYTIIGAKIAF